jgi:hypothetical protein
MWNTSLGDRVLTGAEWELFRTVVSTLWDDIESQEDDEEPGTTGVNLFDHLPRPDRLALLAQVATGLHDRAKPYPDLTALNEATVAAVFAQIRYLVAIEIDAQRSGFGPFSRNRNGRPREMVLATAREINAHGHARLPKASSDDSALWFSLIDILRFRILDDVDYLATDVFLDAPPDRGRSMKAHLGIPEDYFTATPPAATRQGLEATRADLRRVCRRPEAWPTQS